MKRIIDSLNNIEDIERKRYVKKQQKERNDIVNDEGGTILLPNNTIHLTAGEFKKFNRLKQMFKDSMSPGEATYYKNEIETLIAIGKSSRT